MKLHLPLTLLAALLAALTQPTTYAADTEYTIAPISVYDYTDSGILEGIEYDGYDFTADSGQVITMNNSLTTITGESSITLTNGGSFNMSAGTLGSTPTAMVIVTIGSTDGQEDSIFNITGGTVATAGQVDFAINKGGVLNVQDAKIGFGSGAAVNIEIEDGGTFNLRKDGRLGEVGSHVEITVNEGGVFNVDTSGNISARNAGSSTITVDGGTMITSGNVLSSACTYGELIITNGGTLTQNGGAVAYGLISYDPRGVTVTVNNNGSYVLNNGNFGGNMGAGTSKPPVAVSISNGGSFTQNGGAVGTFTTELTFELENGSYTMYGGSLGNSSGTFNFTLSESSSFLMNGSARILGAVQFSVSSNSTFTQSGGEIIGSTHITLGEDTPAAEEESTPTYSMTGGDIAGNVSIDVYQNASFVMSGDAEISGSASITLHGGSFTQQGGTFGGSASLIMNAGASYTLADGTFSAATLSANAADISILQTGGSMQTSLTLENGAIFQQSGGSFSGSIAASGEDTAVTQLQDGNITDATITLTDGAGFTQSGSVTGNIRVSGEDSLYTQESGIIGSGSSISLSEGGAFVQNGGSIFADVVLNDATASFTQKGTLSGSVTLNGGATFTQEASGNITGDVTVNNGTFTQSDGAIGGNVAVNGSSSEFVQDGTIGGDVTVSSGGNFTNNDSAIQGSLTVDNASFDQSGTVGQNVAVQNGGTLTQSSADAVVSGNVTVSGASSSFTQRGSIGGYVLLQSGTYTQQSGDTAGVVEVQGGTYEQQGGSISGGLTLVKGSVTQQSDGSIRGGISMQGGEFTQNGSVVGNVVMSGGSYTMASAGASLTGDVTVTGANFTQEAGSITGIVSVVGGSFSQAGSVSGGVSLSNGADYTLTTNGVLSDGSLTIDGGSSFTMTDGSLSRENVGLVSGSITVKGGTVSESTITAAAGTSITIAGGNVESSTSIVLTDAQLTLANSASSMMANVEMNGASASYDINGEAASGNITIKGGNLANAESFSGSITVDTAADYTNVINLGGVAGERVSSVNTRSAETIITGLKAGSVLSFSGTDNSMVVGTNTSTTKISGGSDYLLFFNNGSGTVNFKDDAQLTLNFSSDLIIEAAQMEIEGEMRIHITNGTLTAAEGNFVFGSGFKDYITFKSVNGGDLVVTINVDNIWISSQDGTLVEDNTIDHDTMVVVDDDTTIQLKSNVNEVTLHHLIGDGSSVGNLDIIADHEQTITLNNDTDGNTVYNGNITVSGDAASSATLEKTGAGSLTLGGVLSSEGTLDVQEGSLVLNSAGNSVAQLEMGDDAELSIVGSLTLKDSVSHLHTGSITGGGELIVDGGEVDLGAVTVQANLTVKGAEVTQGGVITGDVLVTGISTFYHNADINGSVTLGMGANLSSNKDADISGSVTILAEAENTQVMLQGEIGQDATISGDGSRIDGVTKVGGNVEISGEGASLTGDDAEIGGSVTLTGAEAKVEGVTDIGGNVTVSGNAASLEASGTITGTVTLSGESSSVTAAGITGDVSITGADSALTVTGSTLSGDILLNGSGAALDLNSQTISNSGSLTINDGKLVNASGYTGNVFINTSSSIGSDSLSLGGLNAENVKSIKTAGDLSITDLASGSTLTLTGKDNLLTIGSKHVGLNGATAAEQLIQFTGSNGQIAFADNAAVMLQFTEELLSSFINGEMKIAITNGSIAGLADLTDDAEILNWLRTHFLLATGSGLEFAFFSGEEGDNTIVITAGSNNVWKTSDEFAKVTEVDTFDSYTKVIIDRTTTVAVAAEVDSDHMTIRQLEGSSDLNITNSGTEELTVELRNESFFNTDGEQQSWGATVYNGNISAAGGVNIEKTGNDTLLLNGNLSTDGALDVTNGTLVLNGDHNSVGSLSFHKKTAERDDKKDVADNVLEVSGMLTLTGQSEMGTDEQGTIAGSGLIVVEQNATLKVGENVHLNGPAMQVEGELDVTATQDATLGGLFGSGTLTNGSNGLTISDGQGVFSGTLAGSGALNISGSAQQTLVGQGNADYELNVTSRKATLTLEADEATYGDVTNDGVLRIAPEGTGTAAAATGSVTVQSAKLSAGSSTEFVVNFDSAQGLGASPILHSEGTVIMESGQVFVVEGIGTGVNMPSELEIVLVQADNGLYDALTTYDLNQGNRLEDGTILQQVETRGLFNLYYENSQAEVKEAGTQIVFTAEHRTSNLFAPAADTVNSRAGSELLWEARNSLLVNTDATPILAQATAVVADMAHAGRLAETRRALAAVAGSTVPAISAAQSDALRQQIDRTRQHAQLGLAPAKGTEKLAAHAWVEGIGTFARLSTQGDESGYTLNSWGGSVGADMEIAPHVTLGVSLTALYGDLEATAAETATGKLDAYYLSFFVRGTSGPWVHSLALVGGISNANLDRRVDLGDFAYTTTGSTNGTALGAMYEVAYSIMLDQEGRNLLLPTAGIMINSVSMSNYSESRADGAGLHVSDQSRTVATLVLGTRWITELNADTFGKNAVLELSAAIAQDMGDTRSKANVALLGNPTTHAGVQGAESGNTSCRLGAGIWMPMGDTTKAFINGYADLRSGNTLWNVNAGVQFTF